MTFHIRFYSRPFAVVTFVAAAFFIVVTGPKILKKFSLAVTIRRILRLLAPQSRYGGTEVSVRPRGGWVFSLFLVPFFFVLFFVSSVHAASLADRFSGAILLQVESKGEAWYVDPIKKERWYLGRPDEALAVIRKHGMGMTNANLVKIPRGDSQDRGNAKFAKRFRGRILLQVEERGEAWYIFPKDGRRYFLGRPADALHMMRRLGVGITDTNIATIPVATGSAPVISVMPLVIVAETPALPTSSDVGTPTSATPSVGATSSFQNAMRSLVNTERSSAGVSQLTVNDLMNTAAQRFTEDMIARDYVAVKTPEGKGTKDLLNDAGYEARATGMLIATGPPDASVAFTLWVDKKDNDSSRAVLVKGEYEEMGVGFTRGGDEQNIWVVFFASSQVKYEERIAAALSDMDAMRQAMLVRVNDERAKQGLSALAMHPTLHLSAQKKSEDMFAKDYFAHESPDGVTPHQLITNTGYPARTSAENLAKGPKSVDEVMTGWMNSLGHRANILLNGIEEAGFGLKLGRNASGFQIFWTQHFGKR